ncbi:MAG: hypothetical protein ACREDR_03875, partial [Blastocatellia bacterium]
YSLDNQFKHEAQALQQVMVGPGATLDPVDAARLEAVNLLRRCIREILMRVLSDQCFADTLVDYQGMKSSYPVHVSARGGGVRTI